MPMTEEAPNEEILLLRLTRTERKVLIANLRYSTTKDNRHLRNLNMGVELWYLAQSSLVEKRYANSTEKPDWDDWQGWRNQQRHHAGPSLCHGARTRGTESKHPSKEGLAFYSRCHATLLLAGCSCNSGRGRVLVSK